MLVGLCSVKGSPGVTTTAVALAARWPGVDSILIEADPAGGDLAARFGLSSTPGLVSLAAAARRSHDPALLAEHSQVLPGELRVVLGPLGAERAGAALEVLGARGLGLLRAVATDPESVVLVDAGRVDPTSPVVPLLRGADALLVLTRPQAEDLSHAATLLTVIPTWSRHPGLVLVGPGYPRAEVERGLGIPVVATLPHDPRGANVLCGWSGGRGPRRSALGHAAARLANQIHTLLDPQVGSGTDQKIRTMTLGTESSAEPDYSPASTPAGLPAQRAPVIATGDTAIPGITTARHSSVGNGAVHR